MGTGLSASELRIGNWIEYLGEQSQCDVNTIYAISLISKPRDSVMYKPIPLSEDWLIRFGFEKSDALGKETQRVCVIDNFHVVIDFQEYWGWCYAINSIQVVPIKYVHTLQNLIFALTGTELQTALSGINQKG